MNQRRLGGFRAVVLPLLIAIVAAIVGGWWYYFVAARTEIAAYIRVSDREPVGLEDHDMPTGRFRRRVQSQITLLTSPLVVDAALQNPEIKELQLVRAHKPNALQWLQEKLEVDWSDESTIVRLSLRVRPADAQDGIRVVDGVLAAYQQKVRLEQNLEWAARNEAIAKSRALVQTRLEELLSEDVQALDASTEQPSIADRVAAEVRSAAKEELRRLLAELTRQQAVLEIRAQLQQDREMSGMDADSNSILQGATIHE